MMGCVRAAAALVLLARQCGASCAPSAGYNMTRPPAPRAASLAAVVVRGDALRDCGHGERCGALGALPSLAAARSQLAHVVAPLEAAGYRVDVYVSTYRCGRDDFDAWLALYGAAAVAAPPAADARRETQRDTLLRGLALVAEPVALVVVVRADLLFVRSLFPEAVRDASEPILFHADMTGGRHGAVSDRPRGSGAVTDKLHVLKGHAGASCFVDAVLNDACFNDLDDDDDDGSYLSGEGCYGPLQKRVGDAGIAFLRDLVPGTAPGTLGDNELGDSLFRVVPRSLADLSAGDRGDLLGARDLGPYASGRCRSLRPRRAPVWVADVASELR